MATGVRRRGRPARRAGLVATVDESPPSQQLAAGRRICQIVCVQNKYNLVYRADDALVDVLAQEGIAYVPFFRSAAGLRSSSLPPCSIWRNGSARHPRS